MITTITVLATGVVLLLSGRRSDLVFNLHKVAFIVWVGCFAVHFLAHLPQTAHSLRTGWHGERHHHRHPEPAALRDGAHVEPCGARTIAGRCTSV